MCHQYTIDYSINYTTIDNYCNSKSAVALSLNITHNSFDDIRNFYSHRSLFIYNVSRKKDQNIFL